jgi:hypothetical protein
MKKSPREKLLELTLEKVAAKLVWGAPHEEIAALIYTALRKPRTPLKRQTAEQIRRLAESLKRYHPRFKDD